MERKIAVLVSDMNGNKERDESRKNVVLVLVSYKKKEMGKE